MKLKNLCLGVSTPLLMMITGCSGSAVKVNVESPDFKVMEAAPGGRESWLDTPQQYADEKGMDNKMYYYVGESRSADKRMACEKAHANSMDDVAKQVATFVDTTFTKAASESAQSDSQSPSGDSRVSEETQKISSQLSKVQLSSISVKKQYWERRNYSESGGAKNINLCWVLVAASKQDISNLISRATQLKVAENAELKAKVEESASKIDEKYEQWQKSH